MKNKKHKKRNLIVGLTIFIVVALIGVRMYLPYWLKDYVNDTLNNIEGYSGKVDDVDIFLWRGAYSIQNLILKKTDNNISTHFLDIKNIDFSVQWKALFQGRIVSEVYLDDAKINFITNDDYNVQTGVGVDWTKPIQELMPIDINIVHLNGGKINYIDYSTSPDINLFINDINGEITNLRNVVDKEKPLPSNLYIIGNSIGGGDIIIDGNLNILKQSPDFDMNLKLEKADLKAINEFTEKHAALDFAKGTLSVYSEIVVKDGVISGYVKPLITDIQVVDLKQDNNLLELFWETIASIILEIFENQSQDQFAAKVPISGNLQDVDTDSWATIGSILRNAFIEAFKQDTDNSINFSEINKAEEKKAKEKTSNSPTAARTTQEWLKQSD